MSIEDMIACLPDSGVEMLQKSKLFLTDGTFESCPALFAQTYFVMAAFEGQFYGKWKAYRASMAFLKDKTEDTYHNYYMIIQEQQHSNKPYGITADFEASIHQVASRCFNFPTLGCFSISIQLGSK